MALTESKTVRRISSLFSMGSSRDEDSSQKSQASTSGHLRTPSQNPMTGRAENPSPRRHSASGHNPMATDSISRLNPQATIPPPKFDPSLAAPLMPPPPLTTLDPSHPYNQTGSAPNSRPGSRPNSRPQTPTTLAPPGGGLRGSPTPEAKITKRRSWLPGRSRGDASEETQGVFAAWIAGLQHRVMYDVKPLTNGERVS
jgi:hypothetical protein